MTYEALLKQADNKGLIVKEKNLLNNDGLINNNRIAIRKTIDTQVEKSCVLAEELGHYYTTYGNILDQSETMNRKQEYRARLYGYNLKIGLLGIIHAYENGCRSLHETADYLEVTEEYLKEAIGCYKSKHGVCVSINNYVIYFIPKLAVLRIMDK